MNFQEILDGIEVNRAKFNEVWEKLESNDKKIVEVESEIKRLSKISDSYNSDLSKIRENNRTNIEKIGVDTSYDSTEQEGLIFDYKETIKNKRKILNCYEDIILSKDENGYIANKYFLDYVKEKYSNLKEISLAHRNEINNNIDSINDNFVKLGLKQVVDIIIKIMSDVFPQEAKKKEYINYLTVCNFVNNDIDDAYLRLAYHELEKQKKAFSKAGGRVGDPNQVLDSENYMQFKKFQIDLYDAMNNVENLKSEISTLESQIKDNIEKLAYLKSENDKFNEELKGKSENINAINNKMQVVQNELNDLIKGKEELIALAKELNDKVFNEEELENADADPIAERILNKNDIMPKHMYIGNSPLVFNLGDIELKSVQPYFIKTEKPFILVFDGANKEAKETTEYFYKIIENMILYIITHMYHRGFKFEIIDNKMSLRVASEHMKKMGQELNRLSSKEYDMIEFITGKDHTAYEKIISDKDNELNEVGYSNIKDANANEKGQNIIKYTFVCNRVYGTNDLKMDNINSLLTNCEGCGIFNFIFISKDLFDENISSFELPIKQICNRKFYTVHIDKSSSKYINIKECKL
ncbi:MAG: hypothetical protein J6M39_05055 [Lachnospiraceae bacterium]|nr:hypothetical protein [Lachnospiraceae bacterium]